MTTVTHILDDLQWRGIVADTTDPVALRDALDAGRVTFYCGFDPTAPSLHFGNLVQLVTMRRLQAAGHRPIGLVGGATGLIGDPSGRTSERVLNETEVVAGWVGRIRAQVERFLSFEGDHAAVIVNNLDWTRPLSTVEFLRDVGKHFSVNRMLAREAVAARLEAGGISYTEFSYQILQSLDYLELHRRLGCTLQTGGSDQWGNITAGVDLVRRVTGAHVHAMSTQLLLKSDGSKFGKTAGGAVWLDPQMTSPYAFHQYLLNTEDADVGRLLRVFSFRGHDEIAALERATAERPAARDAQHALADELTTLVHGAAETERANAAARAVFGRGDLAGLDPVTLDAALATAPHVVAEPGQSYAELFAAVGLVPSRSSARRAVAEGGAYVNNVRLRDADEVPDQAVYLQGAWLVLRRGKRAVAGVRHPAAGPLDEAARGI